MIVWRVNHQLVRVIVVLSPTCVVVPGEQEAGGGHQPLLHLLPLHLLLHPRAQPHPHLVVGLVMMEGNKMRVVVVASTSGQCGEKLEFPHLCQSFELW